ncbi:6-hydroxymethylpterin diphosphokinase MptE-like protein [Parvularcula dongshanensis]|uniref:6-hydroxymethylpterin diphosphokinase MptE-like domain-containing protein n=1 Tax=Parvularcula dongshanensis TaxID=1173995 RepID=A0A840I3P2_9PROT|nr:6-hydroxymethylpterin diphosphokinase MptE-like protein [Parvularcula dongshanensis]MBB4658945.1 hypothetical protein [Parvularcula dongshanensis]
MTNSIYDDFIQRRRRRVGTEGEIDLSSTDRERLASLAGKFSGQRIFIVGNGPSLNKIDFEKLRGEYTFAANRIYLMFDRTLWRPTFYTAIDWRVTPDIRDEIIAMEGIEYPIFPTRYKGFFDELGDPFWFKLRGGGPRFSDQFSHDILNDGVAGRGSVLVQAIQIAFYLGFSPIYLVGVDVSYRVPSTVIQEGGDRFGTGTQLLLTSTQDDDENHFDPRYFGAGRKWHDPNTDEMIRGFVACRKGVEFYGGKLLNATVGGNLNQIPRVDFDSLF